MAENYAEYKARLAEGFDVEFNRRVTPFVDDPRLWRVLHDLLFQWYVRGHLDAQAAENHTPLEESVIL